MMKMFLGASSASLLSIAFLRMIPGKHVSEITGPYVEGHCERGAAAAVLGGSLIGLGMALGGACPGTVIVQVG
jgi:uncharacterized membrane protein YedE/YeeE